MDKKKVSVVIPAGGVGSRFGRDKQLFEIAGKSVLQRTIEIFAKHPLVDQIVVVTTPNRRVCISESVEYNLDFAEAGEERFNSVYNGLIKVTNEVVAIHDGVRPFITEELITSCLLPIMRCEVHAVFPGTKPVCTIRGEDHTPNHFRTLDRSRLWEVQTPQVFMTEYLINSFERFFKNGNPEKITDDIHLVELYGPMPCKIKVVQGLRENIKVTIPEDIIFAEAILHSRGEL